MYNIIKTFCENNTSNGLFLLDMPTGFGKTYSVLKFVFDESKLEKNKDRRFIIITPLKKNLPISTMRKLFEEEKKLKEFEKKVLFINSNSEAVLENFSDDIEKKIPENITQTKEYDNFQTEIKLLQALRKNNDIHIKKMLKDSEKTFRENTEPTFRKKIYDILSKKYKKIEQRLLAIKTENDWKWVGELYPAVFTRDKQIIFMSMDKFLTQNATIIEPSYQFLTSDIIDNAVIFIDEFDSTKETMLKHIIQNGLNYKIDLIEIFNSIYSTLKTNTFPTALMTPSEQRKNSEYGKQSLEKIIEDIREEAQEIHDTYSLQFTHRTAADAEDYHKNFLFQDHTFHSILNGKKKFIVSVSNPQERINTIHFTDEKPELEEQNVHVMLGKLRNFIKWFQSKVNILAINYRQLKNEERKNGEDEFTQEESIESILSLFNLSEYNKDYLIKQIMTVSKSLDNEQVSSSKFDISVYENGFRYYCFENDAMHDMQSRIMMYSFQNTPEKLLLRLCKRAKVIGISATATLPTVLGNFDLEYLQNKMQDNFYKIPKSEYQRLEGDFNNSRSGYKKISIHTQLLGAGDYSLQTWIPIFNDEDLAENVYYKLEREVMDSNNNYDKERYARIAMAFKAFYEHDDIKSTLCLLTKHPAKNDKVLSIELVDYILKLIVGLPPDTNQKNPYLEYLKGEDYDTQKENILARLANGEKLLIISTYQTIGAGQNLQYQIPSELKGKLICTNNKTPRKEKDFDAIYLDKPTNLFANIENNWQEENFIKYLFQIEFLQEAAELSPVDTMKHVRKAFKCYSSGIRQNEYVENVYIKNSFNLYATRTIIQAIGRICRTNQKNPDIYIFADDRIADCIDSSVDEERIFNNEFVELLKIIKGKHKEAPPIDNSLKNNAELVSNRAGVYIDNMLNGKWNAEKMNKWQELRQIVLRFPTVSDSEAKKNIIFCNFYIKLPQQSNILYYIQERDFRNVNISFERMKDIHYVEDETKTRLDRLMKWEPLRNYFTEQGYAISFKPDDYIMSPSIWNNIYKGALGEVAGKFWFSHVLNINLEEIIEPEKFELFDFKIPGKSIYVDFKNWDENTEMNWNEEVNKIREKAKQCGCKCVIIANIITQTKHYTHKISEDNIDILTISSLLRDNGSIIIDNNAVEFIRRCLNEFDD